jgi:Zn-dependent protease
MQLEEIIVNIVVGAIPILLAITVHEASHGYVAKYFGDLTAERLGRISLNPFKHIDPVGTLLLPALTLIFGGVLFGWAKPVPVNFGNLRHPKKDMLWVAAAGPASNFVMAVVWGMLLGYVMRSPHTSTNDLLSAMSGIGIEINIILMVLNLLPMPPLDGGRIAVSLLPSHLAIKLAQVERYGFVILIVLAVTGVLSYITSPFKHFFEQLILRIFA